MLNHTAPYRIPLKGFWYVELDMYINIDYLNCQEILKIFSRDIKQRTSQLFFSDLG